MSTAEEAQLVEGAYVQEIPTAQLTSRQTTVNFERTLNYDKTYGCSRHTGRVTWNLSLTAQRIG